MAQQPKLIIHGGAGSLEGNIEREASIRSSLKSVCEKTYNFLLTSSANDAVIYGVKLLEDDPLFNAGTGSKIQGDGQIRMSAGLMDGHNKKFSGVINICLLSISDAADDYLCLKLGGRRIIKKKINRFHQGLAFSVFTGHLSY